MSRRLALVLAAGLVSCIPPAPCCAGRPRLELACEQIARQLESEFDAARADEYRAECLYAADAQQDRCERQ